MKTHEFKTEKGEFVVVDMPSYVVEFTANKSTFKIGETKCKLICKLSEATEEDVSNIVDILMVKSSSLECDYSDMLYRDYTCNKIGFKSALESLHSLLTSKGIDIINGNWYLFKKI